MRIAITGAASTGKSTLVRDFLAIWNNYKTPTKSYREFLVENKLPHSDKTTIDTQKQTLDFMIEQAAPYNSIDDNIIFDRCTLDNLIYSMLAFEQKNEGFTQEFINESISKVKKSFSKLDVIFLTFYSESIGAHEDGMRCADVKYIKSFDNLLKVIYQQYKDNPSFYLFDPEDKPALIPLFTTSRQQRLLEIANYVSLDGTLIEPDNKWVEALCASNQAENVKESVEQIIKDQKDEIFKTTGLITP